MEITLIIAFLFLVSFLCQWAAWRSRLPAILFLLVCGLALGPLTNWLDPDELLGDLLFPFVSLSVAIILFEGALTLRFAEVRTLGSVVHRLVTIGALAGWVITSAITYWLFDLHIGIAILLGAITVVTGPTVIIPMLRTVRPSAKVAKILRWEGIVIDPIGALLAVVVYEFIASLQTGHALIHSIETFLLALAVGFGLGGLTGFYFGKILQRMWVPDYLLNLATLAHVFLVFTVSNYFAHESGLLAVTVFGMWLANTKGLHTEEILNFKENLSILLISGLFILLAARISLDDVAALGWGVIILLLCMQFIARPISVWLSTVGSDLNWREKALLSWIAPRGIVAAAVSALFALRLQEKGFEGAEALVALTFSVILGTVLWQSLTAKKFAQMLGASEPSPQGFLIVGANSVARKLAKALNAAKVEVMLCDTDWNNISQARMAGLNTFYGNPVSEYADQKLDLVGLGKLLAVSKYKEPNDLASMRYRSEFGYANVFSMRVENDVNGQKQTKMLDSKYQGRTAFNTFLTVTQFEELIEQGAEIKQTKITEEFSLKDFQTKNEGAAIPLFVISPDGHVEPFCDGKTLKAVEPDCIILSLDYARAEQDATVQPA